MCNLAVRLCVCVCVTLSPQRNYENNLVIQTEFLRDRVTVRDTKSEEIILNIAKQIV